MPPADHAQHASPLMISCATSTFRPDLGRLSNARKVNPLAIFMHPTNLLISESSYYCRSTRVVIIIVEPASRDPGEGRRFSKIFSLLYTLVARKPLYFRSLLSQCSLEPPTTCPPQRSSSGAEARRGAFTPAVYGRASGRRAT